jgi:hypothetical protein
MKEPPMMSRYSHLTRRTLVAGSASLLAVSGHPVQPTMFAVQSDRGLLDMLYVIEELQVGLYEELLSTFDEQAFTAAGMPDGSRTEVEAMLEAERTHLSLLVRPEIGLASSPVKNLPGTLREALQEAAALEDFAVAAYAGIIPVLGRERIIPELIGIHSVEARHAAWISSQLDANPFPDAVDSALSPEDVLERLEVLTQDSPSSGTPAAGEDSARIVEAIASEVGAAPADITVVTMEARDWPDSSLGCPKPGEAYADVITPGFLIIVEIAGEQSEFHTDERGSITRCP